MTTKVELHKRHVKLVRSTATYYTLRWYGSDGKRHSESLGSGLTWARAKARKREKETALSTGRELVDRPEQMTLKALLEYHQQAIRGDVSPRTLQEYGDCGKHVLAVLGADKLIDRISMADVGKLKTYMRDERGARPATVHKLVRHFRAVLNVAVRDELLARNPLRACRVQAPPAKDARIYEPAEIKAMIGKAPTEWWRVFLKLAFSTGLRSGELLSLRWADVDSEKLLVHVKSKDGGAFTVNGDEYPLLEWRAKSKAGYRSVPITQETAAVLKTYRTDTSSPYVFLSLDRLRRIGRSMAAGKWRADSRLVNNTLRAFQAIHEAAKLPEPAGTVHDARKTWCTLTAAVVPMHVLQKWAGHAKIETTATYYTRVRESDADRLRDAMRDDAPDLRLVG